MGNIAMVELLIVLVMSSMSVFHIQQEYVYCCGDIYFAYVGSVEQACIPHT